MSQHDQNIANDTGAAVRADINNALAALFGNSSGATAPATTIAYMWWADTSSGILKQRNAANSAWVNKGTLADDFSHTTGTFTPSLTFGGNAVGMTYSAQLGRYTKLANRVLFNIVIGLTAKGSSTGNASISGLPFASIDTDGGKIPVTGWGNVLTNITTHMLVPYINKNTAAVTLAYLSGGLVTAMNHGEFNNTTEIMIAGAYEAPS